MEGIETSSTAARSSLDAVKQHLVTGDWPAATGMLLKSPEERVLRARSLLRYGLTEAARSDLDAARPLLQASALFELEDAFCTLLAYGDAGRAAQTAERLLSQAVLSDTERARTLVLRGIAAHRLDRWETALRDLVEALRIADSHADIETRIDTLRAMAVVESWRARHNVAMLHLTLAIADCARLHDQSMLSDILGDCARLNLEMRRYAYALDFFHRQEEIGGTWLSGRTAIRLNLGKAQALAGLRRDAEAMALLDSVANAAQREKLEYLQIMALHCQAMIELQRGAPHRSLELVSPFLTADKLAENAFEYIALEGIAAEASMMLGDPSSNDRYMRVIGVFQDRNLIVHEVEARLRLGAHLADKGDGRAAVAMLRSALARCRMTDLELLERKVRETMVRLDLSTEFSEEVTKIASSNVVATGEQGYILLAKLGSGTFATVYRAFDVERGRDVAFKRFILSSAADAVLWETVESSARAELRVASRLHHPGIARVLAIGTEPDGSFYTVQDFISGSPLRLEMQTNRNTGLVCLSGEYLARSLSAMHLAGVTHRDIKPDNIICQAPAKPVIIDLGLATLTGADLGTLGRGTLGYASPEQWQGDTTGPATDIYALGVVLHEWFLGHVPAEDNRSHFLPFFRPDRISHDDRKSLQALGTEALVHLLESMISLDPSRRPSAGNTADRLADIARGLPQ